ncbi:sugar ABC transporter ATP-binding protein [Athalassotoga saccharophila]|uniref:sugar ABC transporter ATP-binding protein n=1 Tax=Athalassotoga saccharophila TaxID=1441386 RepID=UPI00137A5A4F|nr:sugar ABC transporter ATP-binding protein [Athalassotoga saccharophila]BBJ27379.1 ribose import ATP-binding protein RbsA [Athalassotoga saccharophila]
MDEILRTEKLSKSFPGVQALKNVDFQLKKGEVHALVGQNGAGKSTLVKILAGVYKPDSGNIFLDGKKVEIKDPNYAISLGISTVHQSLIIFPDLTVLENMFIDNYSSSSIKLINWKNFRNQALKIMNEVGINIPLDQEAKNISAPMQKLLQILRSLLKQGKILILDEPTAALTSDETKILFENIKKLKNKGISIIYISHLLEEIFELADTVTVFRNGEVVMTDSISNLNLGSIVKAMIGRELQTFYPRRDPKIGSINLKVENINSGILRSFSMELKKGEVLGIAGILGSGRTTLANTLFGITPATDGSIFLNNKKINIKAPSDAVKEGIVLIPEDRQREGLILQQSIKFNISLPNVDLIKNKNGFLDPKKGSDLTNKAIKDFEIQPPFPDFQVLHLSGGNQQKIVISKWLVRDASIIIMDEPTQGIDVGSKAQIYTWINKFVEEGRSVIFISSDFDELVNMCDRIIVLRKGVVAGELKKPNLSIDELIALSTLEERDDSFAVKSFVGESRND